MSKATDAGGDSDTSLDGSLTRGIAWTAGIKWLIQLLTWASTLIVARLLTPEDYGLFGMAMVYLGLVEVINEFGLGASIVAKRELTDNQIAQLNTVSVLFGVSSCTVSCMAAVPLSLFFASPELRWVVVAMSASFVVSALQVVPKALLQKELRFKLLALIDATQGITQTLCMVAFALLGLNYWTLVLGGLVGVSVSTSLLLAKRGHSFARPRLGELKYALTFSWHVLLSRLSWYATSHSDFLVAGRVLGKTALGAYTIGWTLSSIPVDKITAIVGRVTYPIFSNIQKDVVALRRYLLTLTEALALVTFPAAWGLALVAEEFVLFALGEKWRLAVAPLRLLALSTTFRAVDPLLPQILFVMGGSRFGMRLGVLSGVVMPLSFYIGSRWGTVGIAAAWVVAYPLMTVPLYWWVFRKIELSTVQYIKVLWPALSGSLMMAALVILLKLTLPQAWPLPLRLGIEIVGGVGAYVLTTGTLHRERLLVLYRFFRTIRG